MDTLPPRRPPGATSWKTYLSVILTPRVRTPMLLVALLLAAVACSDEPDPSPPTSTPTTTPTPAPSPEVIATATGAVQETDSEADRVEHEAPQPRLVMIEADTGTIQVLDTASGEVVGRLESAVDVVSPGEAPAVSENGRFVFFSHYSQDRITIVDAGTWTAPHATHAHHFTAAPWVVEIMEGPHPSHVVNHDGVVAAFFDGEARVTVLDQQALDDGRIDVLDTFIAGGPHHGVAVPVDDCFVASLPAASADDPPEAIGAFCDGELSEQIVDCPELHGVARLEDSLVFACVDGLQRLDRGDGGWRATAIPYPEGIEDQDLFGAPYPRAWGFQGAERSPYLAAWAGTTHVYVYGHQDGAGGIRAIDLSAQVAIYGLAVIPGSSQALVLTTDGMLHRLDLERAELIESLEVVAPYEPDLTFATPHHYVVTTADRAFVLDPPTQRVIEVHIDGELATGRVFDLDASIAQVALAAG